MEITSESHVDHISPRVLDYLKILLGQHNGFFITTIEELPVDLEPVPCGLHGPMMGDDPVPEGETYRARRGAREYTSRLCDREPRTTRKLTVIAGPTDHGSCVLYTAFGGPLAPQEPDDPTCKDVEASRAFWAQHALSAETFVPCLSVSPDGAQNCRRNAGHSKRVPHGEIFTARWTGDAGSLGNAEWFVPNFPELERVRLTADRDYAMAQVAECGKKWREVMVENERLLAEMLKR